MLDKQRLRTFLLGGVAGALAGVLLAPRSGRELRGSIAERAGEARERGRETYFEAQERMQERLARTREGSYFPADAEPEKEATVGPGDVPVGPQTERRALRDVSRDTLREVPREEPEDLAKSPDAGSEELRKKVRETRARLRARTQGGPDAGEGRGDGLGE